MDKLLKTVSGNRFILLARFAALFWFIAGIVTTGFDTKVAGLAPGVFFVLGFASIADAICNELFRIIVLLEKRAA